MMKAADVLYKLATKGEAKSGNVRIFGTVMPGGFMCAEDIPLWIVKYGSELFKFAPEDLMEAVDKYLDLISPPVDLSVVPDADELKQQNLNDRTYIHKQWCEEHYEELSMIAQSIVLANNSGTRTIWFDVPQSEVENYYRFFRERHYRVTKQTYSDKDGVMRVTLDWQITDSDRKRLRNSK